MKIACALVLLAPWIVLSPSSGVPSAVHSSAPTVRSSPPVLPTPPNIEIQFSPDPATVPWSAQNPSGQCTKGCFRVAAAPGTWVWILYTALVVRGATEYDSVYDDIEARFEWMTTNPEGYTFPFATGSETPKMIVPESEYWDAALPITASPNAVKSWWQPVLATDLRTIQERVWDPGCQLWQQSGVTVDEQWLPLLVTADENGDPTNDTTTFNLQDMVKAAVRRRAPDEDSADLFVNDSAFTAALADGLIELQVQAIGCITGSLPPAGVTNSETTTAGIAGMPNGTPSPQPIISNKVAAKVANSATGAPKYHIGDGPYVTGQNQQMCSVLHAGMINPINARNMTSPASIAFKRNGSLLVQVFSVDQSTRPYDCFVTLPANMIPGQYLVMFLSNSEGQIPGADPWRNVMIQ